MEKKTKEKKQETLDIETYVATLEDQLSKGFKGVITEIHPITSTLYFKGAGQYDERNGIAVTVVLNNETKDEFSNWIALPNVRGYDQSNLYAFKKRYGSVPKIDMTVDVEIDDNGFFKIKY